MSPTLYYLESTISFVICGYSVKSCNLARVQERVYAYVCTGNDGIINTDRRRAVACCVGDLCGTGAGLTAGGLGFSNHHVDIAPVS